MIKQTIDQDIKSAMLAGNKSLVQALKTLKSALLYAEVAAGKRDVGLPESEEITILQKELKKRAESAKMYDEGSATERADAERYEMSVIQNYLPKQLTEDEINAIIDEAIASYDDELNGQAMGKLIAAVKQKSGGAADGALTARLVKARLS